MSPTSARRPLPLRMSGGATGSTTAIARSAGVSDVSSERASRSSPSMARSPARGPSGIVAGLAPRNDGAGRTIRPSMTVGLDGDVVPAEPPRPRIAARRVAEDRQPVALGVAPLPVPDAGPALEVAEDRLERHDRADLRGPALAHRGIDDGPGEVPLTRRHGADGKAAPRARPVVPHEPLVAREGVDRLGTPLGVERVQPRDRRGAQTGRGGGLGSPGRGRHSARAASSRSRIRRVTPSTGTRSWAIESRSRTVTAPSSSESTSTVTHHGVPISSCRR